MRVAINGMGRIGRLLFRKLLNHPSIEMVAVNDIMPADNLVYLLKYDSIFGPLQEKLSIEDDHLQVAGKSIAVFNQPDPSLLPWSDLRVDTVLECTGIFSDRKGAELHLAAGASQVLLSTTGSDDIPLMIYGHNHKALAELKAIISPGGCMTNCSTHILYILNSIGIESAQINVLHSYTSRQALIDSPHKQFRRGRAAAESIIPVDIDLYRSLEKLIPGLQGKIGTVSIRVPVASSALADFTVQLKSDTTAAEINNLFRSAACQEYKGIIDYTEDPLVSQDIKANPHSCVVDGTLTSVIGKQVKLMAWFDNEYGFTSRMIDWLEFLDQH